MKYLSVLVFLAAAAIAQPNYYAASYGNDANACTTPAAPCLTFQAAINKALVIDGGAHGAFISCFGTCVDITYRNYAFANNGSDGAINLGASLK